MQTLRRRLRPLTWLTLVAMLGLALLPAVSHALAGAGGASPWGQVCTVRGLARVEVSELPAGQGDVPTAGAFAHCPCWTHAAAPLGPPPAPLADRPAPRAGAEAPRSDRLALASSAPWTPAQPRAPPPTRT